MSLTIIFTIIRSSIITPLIEEFIFRYSLKNRNNFFNKLSQVYLLIGLPFLVLCTYFKIDIYSFCIKIVSNLLNYIPSIYDNPYKFYNFVNSIVNMLLNANLIWLSFLPFAIAIVVIGIKIKIPLFEYFNSISTKKKIIISSVLFMLNHIEQLKVSVNFGFYILLLQVLYFIFGGVIFSIIRIKFGFKYSVLLHMIINLATYLMIKIL